MYLVSGGWPVHLPCVHRPGGSHGGRGAAAPLLSSGAAAVPLASPFNGSRWLMIPVTDEAVLTDVKALIGIRAAA